VATVRCPDCGQDIPLPPGTQSGDVIDCPNCAGLALRVRAEASRWTATIAHRASCPDCNTVITLLEDARAGDTIECAGRRYRLTFEYGAFAAEPDSGPPRPAEVPMTSRPLCRADDPAAPRHGGPSTPAARRSVKGYLPLGLAVVTCPCHLPLLLAILAGTSLAGVLSQYLGLAFLTLTLIFVLALLLGSGRSGGPRTARRDRSLTETGGRMKLTNLRSSAVGMLSASVASLCCLLPLAIVVLGLGSGAFMAVTMQYASVFIPAGILGTGVGYYLYFRERTQCGRLGCAMAGSRVNLALLMLSTLILGVAVTLTALPEYTARLIASWGGTVPMAGAMAPARQSAAQPTGKALPTGQNGSMVAVAHVTLQVDGMT
jgi:mercuric ion transport protein